MESGYLDELMTNVGEINSSLPDRGIDSMVRELNVISSSFILSDNEVFKGRPPKIAQKQPVNPGNSSVNPGNSSIDPSDSQEFPRDQPLRDSKNSKSLKIINVEECSDLDSRSYDYKIHDDDMHVIGEPVVGEHGKRESVKGEISNRDTVKGEHVKSVMRDPKSPKDMKRHGVSITTDNVGPSSKPKSGLQKKRKSKNYKEDSTIKIESPDKKSKKSNDDERGGQMLFSTAKKYMKPLDVILFKGLDPYFSTLGIQENNISKDIIFNNFANKPNLPGGKQRPGDVLKMLKEQESRMKKGDDSEASTIELVDITESVTESMALRKLKMITDTENERDEPNTYVGIVINKDVCPSVPQLMDNRYYVWVPLISVGKTRESRQDSFTDIKHRHGGCIRDLEMLVNSYSLESEKKPGADEHLIVWCPIIHNEEEEEGKRTAETLENSFKEHLEYNGDGQGALKFKKKKRNFFGKISHKIFGKKKREGILFSQIFTEEGHGLTSPNMGGKWFVNITGICDILTRATSIDTEIIGKVIHVSDFSVENKIISSRNVIIRDKPKLLRKMSVKFTKFMLGNINTFNSIDSEI